MRAPPPLPHSGKTKQVGLHGLGLHLGHPVEAAMAELGWKYGHFKQAKTGVLDFFFATYVARNRQSPIGFLEWVNTEYNRLEMHNRFRAEGWASLIVDKVLHRE